MSSPVDYLGELKAAEIRETVDGRLKEFRGMGKASDERWFSELCFCILTANSSAETGIRVQRELGAEGFLKLQRAELSRRLRELGYRFYRKRADYIVEARGHRDLKGTVSGFPGARGAREWLVENVKGIGYKEASHFLRNVGFEDVAILDRHVLRTLHGWGMVDQASVTPDGKGYLEIEERLREVAGKVGMTLAELDLYLWHAATGKVLK